MDRPAAADLTNVNALSWWFPKIEAAGLPVPRTIIRRMTEAAFEDVLNLLDGHDTNDGIGTFLEELKAAARTVGFPAFLRTDHTSGKHRWSETCHIAEAGDIPRHVFALVEESECSGGTGLPWETFAVREFLPTLPLGICPAYHSMPVCKEFRCFVHGGEVRCIHPYWPQTALAQGGATAIDHEALAQLDGDDLAVVTTLAGRAGKAVGGDWSIDILLTSKGWHVTDMATARESYHDPSCPQAEVAARQTHTTQRLIRTT